MITLSRSRRPGMTHCSYSTNSAFAALGFTVDAACALRAPDGATIALTLPDGHYYRLAIALPGGVSVSCVVPAVALKIFHEGATRS